ncbi:hypothetical protein Ahy_B04g071526 isoform B [Arachis hypogaea]|uniref:Uncharacterized protein n=1 Tax=Arachis hypogaea TaxID=3818 RepID=A0A444ZKY0_ARAHY|nr:hypothetical protein Ahy_B04g071526 isoform B [Arachis hypogaea]
MEDIANIRVYYDREIIPNAHEGVTFVYECPYSFAIPYTMSFVELQNESYFQKGDQHFVQKSCTTIWWANAVSTDVHN